MITMNTVPLKNQVTSSSVLHQIKLTIVQLDSHQLTLEYRSMPGNQPSAYSNHIHIWQSENYVPWNQKPLKSQPVSGDSQSGAIVVQGMNIGKLDYIIGYSVGASPTQTAATAYIPVTVSAASPDNEYEYSVSSIDVTSAGDSYLNFSYQMPDGYNPSAYGAWVGLWQGRQIPLPTTEPLSRTTIPYTSETGSHSLSNLNLASGEHYCIGLFFGGPASGSSTTLGASCSFVY